MERMPGCGEEKRNSATESGMLYGVQMRTIILDLIKIINRKQEGVTETIVVVEE